MLATPRDYWLKELETGWSAVFGIVSAVLEKEYGLAAQDCQEEIAGELLRRHAQLAIDVPLLQRLGGDAAGAVRAAIAILFEQAPEWKATARTPTRKQVLRQWGSTSHDTDLAAMIDGLDAATLREVARKHMKEGKPLPPRDPSDHGEMCTPKRRAPVVTTQERAGLQIQTIQTEPLADLDSGAMPSVRPAPRRQIGSGTHPRFNNTQEKPGDGSE
jgi:hypothetical protein